jgi:hypothetical protein
MAFSWVVAFQSSAAGRCGARRGAAGQSGAGRGRDAMRMCSEHGSVADGVVRHEVERVLVTERELVRNERAGGSSVHLAATGSLAGTGTCPAAAPCR